ncbi:hypothetical protein HMPREF1565_0987 [Providencia alcalifaciens RIMD 1656011]|uniref:Uncharacterized protein n=1 Tax=Providencia alcalifaciens 205/92 TaxID=1256988 RepID=A0AAV3M7B9_9GAMM|nr:hypothetical protein HMPREF1565_0987 [Providencia alcalifaciens RIMD 1656011]EUD11679.1 hypothetical protein HMPREF1563_0347 [Providencia alcalifaciens 205/92]
MMKKFRFTEIKLAVIYQVEKVDLAIHKLNIYMEYKAVLPFCFVSMVD